MNNERDRQLMCRIVEYHRQFGFGGFDTNCQPTEFLRWYMRYAGRKGWLIGALSAKTVEELDIKLSLNGF